MLLKYFKQSFNYILKNRIDSLINIVGLTIGITSFFILINYISYEFSFDKNIPNYQNIYRIVSDVPQQNGNIMNTAMSSGYFSRSADEYFSEIEASTRIALSFETLFKYNDIVSFENNSWYCDSTFFKVFDLELKQGDPGEVLKGSFKMVISEKMAKKYFGNADPVNQTLLVHNRWHYTISGILKDQPSNMHIDIDFLLTPDSIPSFTRENWGALGLFSYVKLKKSVDPSILENRFQDYTIEKMGEKWADIVRFKLQPIADIHLKSDRLHEVAKTSDLKQLRYLMGIALLILIMAGVNFMNIYSSRAEYRSKEVGLRKVVGANRINLISQFLLESLLFTIIALVLSFIFIYYTWGIFEKFINSDISLNVANILIFILSILFLIGIIVGLYPALYLSSFKPIFALKGVLRSSKNGSLYRKVLVITQFSLSIFMIIATLVVLLQMEFIKSKDLGFEHNNMLTIRLSTEDLYSNNESIKAQLMNIRGVEDICFSSSKIDNILAGQRAYVKADSTTLENTMDFMIRTIWVDEKFIPVYKMKLIKGRNFSLEFPSDRDNSIIANEAAIKLLGLDEPIGARVSSFIRDTNYTYNIIGVIQDFNYQSLHTPVEPLFFRYANENFPILSLKYKPEYAISITNNINSAMQDISPDYPVKSNLLTGDIQADYIKEIKISALYIILTILSILIACLGLFGMVSFILEKKTKSTGIKKVLGASNIDLFISLSKDLFLWMVISVIISFPLSYIVMNKWLQSFAYRIDIYWWIYPLSFLLLFFVSFLTVSYKTIKTITINPAQSLRYE